jgi:hypothetical protein
VTVSLLVPENCSVVMEVNDAAGRLVLQQRNFAGAGSNTIHLPVSSLSKGTYFLRIQGQNGNAIPFIKE